jgi:hypothetical protein
MNLGEIRERVFDQLDWNPNSSQDAKDRVDRFINLCYYQLSLDAPYLFFEAFVEMATEIDKESNSSTDTVTVYQAGSDYDPWVLKRNTASLTDWDTDETWNGRKIQLKDSRGDYYTHNIRDVWTTGSHQYISLETPFRDTAQTAMTYKVYTDSYYLPPEVIRINNVRTVDSTVASSWMAISQQEAENYYYVTSDTDSAVTGFPTKFFRRPPGRLPTPTWTPTVSADEKAAWLGPEPPGTFEYCFTYVHGKTDSRIGLPGPQSQTAGLAAVGGRNTWNRLNPRLESSPSPSSEKISVGATGQVSVRLPDVDFMLGFGEEDATLIRGGHSGWKKRIYRRRSAVSGFGAVATAPSGAPSGDTNIETAGVFYLLDEVDASTEFYTDKGEKTPDYTKRLSESHSQQAIQPHPRPNTRLKMEVRCIARPVKLEDVSDTPALKAEGMQALIESVMGKMYRAEGEKSEAMAAEGRYKELLATLAKRYDSLKSPSRPTRRKACSPNSRRASHRNWINEL